MSCSALPHCAGELRAHCRRPPRRPAMATPRVAARAPGAPARSRRRADPVRGRAGRRRAVRGSRRRLRVGARRRSPARRSHVLGDADECRRAGPVPVGPAAREPARGPGGGNGDRHVVLPRRVGHRRTSRDRLHGLRPAGLGHGGQSRGQAAAALPRLRRARGGPGTAQDRRAQPALAAGHRPPRRPLRGDAAPLPAPQRRHGARHRALLDPGGGVAGGAAGLEARLAQFSAPAGSPSA